MQAIAYQQPARAMDGRPDGRQSAACGTLGEGCLEAPAIRPVCLPRALITAIKTLARPARLCCPRK